MVVDAVMSMVGVGLGDAVVEAVLPGMGSHKRWRPRHGGSRIGGAKVGAALRLKVRIRFTQNPKPKHESPNQKVKGLRQR